MPASGAQLTKNFDRFLHVRCAATTSEFQQSLQAESSIDPNQRLWMLKLDDEPAPQNAGIASFLQL
jgi:hypothetical protein